MSYISGLKVVYGSSQGAVDGEDINKGFSGERVYLVPTYTDSRDKAACGFSIETTYNEDMDANSVSKGDGKELFRYLNTHIRPKGDWPPVVSVHLKELPGGDGYTQDINKDRGGRKLFLCWYFTKQ